MNKLFLLTLTSLLLVSCLPDDTHDQFYSEGLVTVKLTHYWDGELVRASDLGDLGFVNENGNELSITRLRYLLSNLSFRVAGSGSSFQLKDYHLADLSDDGTLSFTSDMLLPTGNYDRVSFTLGFDSDDNSENYPDLNSAGWNWPENLGGGYHFMQMDGNYQTETGPQPYNFHYGTARKSEGVYEANHLDVVLTEDFSLLGSTTLEIRMNLDEWFKNPHTWDLSEYNTNLMGNYEAQIMIRENGGSVFEIPW